MSFSAVDANGRLTPEFAAYTKTTLVNRFKAYGGDMGVSKYGGQNKVSFDDFMKAIQNNRVINHSYSRNAPYDEIQHSRINAQYNGNYEFEHIKMNIVEKAYELGMVGFDGVLLSSFMTKV